MAEPKRKEVDRGQEETATSAQGPHPLDRRLDLTRVAPVVWIFLALLVLAAVLRFSHLGVRAMHHDEAIHAWYSWRFYTGEDIYQYNPTYHGPFLYHLTTLFYFLFGASDPIARAPEALFGLLLVALCCFLRRYLGRWGWLIAAGLLTLSPAFVYFSRFARHDALVVVFTLGTALALFRYLDERRPRDLILAAALLSLAFTTLEVTLIAAFTFFSFFLLAYLLDLQGSRFREGRIIAGIVLGISFLVEVGLAGRGGGAFGQAALMALLLLSLGYLVLSFAWPRLFPRGPSPVRPAVRSLVENPRAFLTALGVFGLIFGLLFTTFLTNPRGLVDGLVQGARYWVGQHTVARGGQPWFYYLLLLVLYEPIVLSAGVTGLVLVLVRVLRARKKKGRDSSDAGAVQAAPSDRLFPLFLAYWALFSLLLYSWAGEKMPWLLLQVALPLVLLAALALDRFLGWMAWRDLWRSGDWAVGPLFLLLFFALRGLTSSLARLHPQGGGELTDQYMLLQVSVLGIILLGLLVLLAWRIYRVQPRLLGQSLAATAFLLLGMYTIRSTFLVNYYNSDTPVEMLVYTQTAPDVPLVVRQIERLGIDQTRKVRNIQDPTGGHGLKIAVDNSLNAGLDWPFNWYWRDFARAGNLSYFDGSRGTPPNADVILVLADNEPVQRPYLQSGYTAMRLKHRWWFPEFETYQRWRLIDMGVTDQGYATMPWLRFATYQPSGWQHLWDYVARRRLPYPPGSQDFFLYIRTDLLPAAGPVEPDPYVEKLTQRPAIGFLGGFGTGPGQLNYPRAIAAGPQGYLYVADSGNHRVVRFDAQGQSTEWGSNCILETGAGCVRAEGVELPLGAGQFNEPWGIAAGPSGHVYVADTWNHRIQVFDANGKFLGQWGTGRLVDVGDDPSLRQSNPYGFYGPRGVAVDRQGNVYVTDTGNERVMVYQVSFGLDGSASAEFWYQWGSTGPETGQFLEPVGIAVDAAGRVYVADTWNLRVQVFAPGSDGKVDPRPEATIQVTGWESDSRENKPYIAVDPGGRIYFTVPDRSYVAVVNLSGKVLAVWGGYGTDLSSFTLPIGVAVDSAGKVYVSDSGNGRVLTFEMP